MLWMFGATDSEGYQGKCAAKGQHYLRRAMTELYRSTADAYSGDDDNGEMSAWFLLSAMGLYSLSPGSSEYVFGSPLYGKVAISLGAGKMLYIEGLNNSAENVYVQRILWEGTQVPLGSNGIDYKLLVQGGTLTFEMGATPYSA